MDRKLIVILASALAVMGLTVWICYPPPPPVIPVADRHFMHCSKCNKELPYFAERFEKECPKCAAVGTMVATKDSLNKTGPPPTVYAKLFPPLMIEANVLLAALLGYAVWKRKNHSDEEFLYVNCGKCSQRLRYRAEKIGATGQCPRCKRTLIFPEAEPEELALPWWQPARWRDESQKLWGRFRDKTRGPATRNAVTQSEDQES